MSKKFEQLLEYVVNDETEKAQAIFHEIVVEKSREIYENLIADETANEGEEFGGDETENLMNEIEAEEYSDMSEAEEEGDMEDMGDEEDMGDDMDSMDHEEGDHEGGMEDMEDRLVDLEDALSQLKAEFDGLMSKDGEEEASMDGDAEEADMDSEEEADMGDEDEMDESSIFEYKEHAPKPVLAEPAGTHATSPLAKNAKSPTGSGKPVAVKDGSQGNHGVKAPGKLTSYDTKGEGTKMKKVQDMKKV